MLLGDQMLQGCQAWLQKLQVPIKIYLIGSLKRILFSWIYLQIYGQLILQNPRDGTYTAMTVSQAVIPVDSGFISLKYKICKIELTDKYSSLHSQYSLIDLDDGIPGGAEEESDEQMARRLHAEWNGTDHVSLKDR